MVCLGLEPWVARWKAQMNPLSYGGIPSLSVFVPLNLSFNIFLPPFCWSAISWQERDGCCCWWWCCCWCISQNTFSIFASWFQCTHTKTSFSLSFALSIVQICIHTTGAQRVGMLLANLFKLSLSLSLSLGTRTNGVKLFAQARWLWVDKLLNLRHNYWNWIVFF